MKLTFSDHRDAGHRLAQALRAAGHELVPSGGEALLIDHDLPFGLYTTQCDLHAKVLLYPHGAGLVASGDGQWPIHPHTRGMFVHGIGQATVLRLAEYPRHVETMGWSFSDRKPFQPWRERHLVGPPRVLLAPQHPLGNGWFEPRLRDLNASLHALLRRLPIQLRVRYIGDLFATGIVPVPGAVEYESGDGSLAGALDAIRQADVVIGSAWTFPCLALAEGVPTIMYGQIPPDDSWGPDNRHPPKHYERYREYSRYPLDADACADRGDDEGLWDLIGRACDTEDPIVAWREAFLGPPFDPADFVAKVERAVATW